MPNVPDTPDTLFPASPPWSLPTRLLSLLLMGVFVLGLVWYFSRLTLYLIVAAVLTFILRPLVQALAKRITAPYWVSAAIVYLLLIAGIIAIPASFLPGIVRQVSTFIGNIPTLVQQLTGQISLFLDNPVILFRDEVYRLPLDRIQAEEYQRWLGNLTTMVSNTIGSLPDFVGNLATGVANLFTWVAFVLFVSFYLTKDGHRIPEVVVEAAPAGYRTDAAELLRRLNLLWSSFLRGQLLLMLTIGLLVFVLAWILGLPNPVALGVTAGLLEIVPYAGPVLSAVPGLLIAWFQSDASWLGQTVGPFWFTMIVLGMYWGVQQLENYVVVPRIMGQQLQLHPIVVFMGAIAGWQVAGIWGVFLASPVIASLLLMMRYGYSKVIDRPIQSTPVPDPPETVAPKAETADNSPTESAESDGESPSADPQGA
jgi:predicted PurR-regulated permease PerM